jgi:hypothetical protein
MALPASAAADLASDMPSKLGGPPPMLASDTDDAAGPEDGDSKVLHEIAGDVFDAFQAGSKDEAAKFLVELVQRVTGGAPATAASPGES